MRNENYINNFINNNTDFVKDFLGKHKNLKGFSLLDTDKVLKLFYDFNKLYLMFDNSKTDDKRELFNFTVQIEKDIEYFNNIKKTSTENNLDYFVKHYSILISHFN